MMGEASVITRKRCSLSRKARSACFCAVMSRATFEAPITHPDESLTGEMVRETSRRLPSFRLRTVWKWSTRSPRRRRAGGATISVAFWWNDQGDVSPNGFFRGIAIYAFRTLIPARDDAIKVLADNGIIGGGYNRSQQTRYFFGLPWLAHIVWRQPNPPHRLFWNTG